MIAIPVTRSRSTTSMCRFLAAVLLLVSVWPPLASAHAPDQSYVFVRVYDNAIEGRAEITVVDLNAALGLALPEDGTADSANFDTETRTKIANYLSSRVAVAPGPEARPIKISGLTMQKLPLGQYLAAHFSFDNLTSPPEQIAVDYRVLFDVRPSHRGFLVVEHNWKTGTFNDEANVALIFAPDSTQQVYQIQGSMLQGFSAMIGQGVHHIWIGIDHILFLFALLLPSVVRRQNGRWQPVPAFRPALIYVVKVVTIFTIAHTVTLSAAAFGALSLPSRVVESIIAASIAIAAIDVLREVFGRKIWWIVFVFGLFHGFGFASVLGDLGIGGEFLGYTLLAFNIGVELGQVAIVAAVFPVLYLLRKTAFYVSFAMPASAVLLIIVSAYWFIERAFNVDLPAGSILHAIIG